MTNALDRIAANQENFVEQECDALRFLAQGQKQTLESATEALKLISLLDDSDPKQALNKAKKIARTWIKLTNL